MWVQTQHGTRMILVDQAGAKMGAAYSTHLHPPTTPLHHYNVPGTKYLEWINMGILG